MKDCIFCKILNKELPGKIVYENDNIFALVPIDQIAEGHLLVIPKKHYKDIFDIPDNVLKELISVTKKISIDLKNGDVTAVNLLNASGIDAQQSVFHFHMHVVPRRKDDGLDLWVQQGL